MTAQTCRFILQFASTAVLARLLMPEDYGLMAMVTVIFGFVYLFKDLGLSSATIQSAEITHKQVSTLFWVNLGVSCCLTLLTAALAPAIALFYGEPRLVEISITLATGFIFGGLGVQHKALLKRQMQFGTLAAIDIASMFVSIAVGIIAAWSGAGYWALVLMQLSTPISDAIGSWVACGWRPSLPSRDANIASMLNFGSNITGFQILNYFSRNLDNILIGWYWGSQQLGIYAKAYQLLLQPFQQLTLPISNVIWPALTRLQNDPKRYLAYYHKGLLLIVTFSMPLVVFMFVDAEEMVRILLGEKWLDAVIIFRLLGPAAFVSTFSVAAGWVYTSLGRADRQFKWAMIVSTVDVISFIIGVRWGAIGVAAIYSITRVALRYPNMVHCYKYTFLKLNDLFDVLWRPTLASIGAGVIMFAAKQNFTINVNVLITVIFDSFIYTSLYIIGWCILPNGRKMLGEILEIGKELINKRKESKNANSSSAN